MTYEEAIKRLVDGNERYVAGMPRQGVTAELRANLLKGQHPYAVVIGCSDSRVPVELIFDAMPGELFVIRTAGNVVGPLDMASVEFAVSAFKPPLVLVLGHQHCGAVYAALKGIEGFSPSIQELLKEVLASAAGVLSDSSHESCEGIPDDGLHDSYEDENIRNTLSKITANPYIAKDIAEKTLHIVAAKYSLETGKVSFFD
jgi:carbonic anhydrase